MIAVTQQHSMGPAKRNSGKGSRQLTALGALALQTLHVHADQARRHGSVTVWWNPRTERVVVKSNDP